MKTLKLTIIVTAITATQLSGCVTTRLNDGAAAVRVTSNSDVIKDCTYIGFVEGKDHFNGGMFGQGAAEENAIRRIRNEAQAMGADTIDLSMKSTGFSGSALRGEAYRCRD